MYIRRKNPSISNFKLLHRKIKARKKSSRENMKVATRQICALSLQDSLQCFGNKRTAVFASPACTYLKESNQRCRERDRISWVTVTRFVVPCLRHTLRQGDLRKNLKWEDVTFSMPRNIYISCMPCI